MSTGVIDPNDVLVGTSTTKGYTDYSGFYNNNSGYEYRYYVNAVNTYGNKSSDSNYSQWAGLVTYEKRARLSPKSFELQENYPNPFNPSTNIKYSLPEASDVSIKVFNVMGQQVAQLANGNYPAGYHQVTFDASKLSSGVYIARFEATGASGQLFSRDIKMQLIK